MEYLDHGTLEELIIKLHGPIQSPFTDENRRKIPNRVLWSFFLCLLSACVGMAYPVGRPFGDNRPFTTEQIGDPNNPGLLTHNDFFPRNIMLAISDGDPEHLTTMSIVKVIDFGFASEGWGAPENIYFAAAVIRALIDTLHPSLRPVLYQGKPTYATDLVGTPLPHTWLDPDLRHLLCTCSYETEGDRPSLGDAIVEAQRGVAKTPDQFPISDQESDAAVYDFMQSFIFNAES
ncbi:hypothetical protein F5Y16DRAFT_380651 [Xylariaceae sp. FL0255]|nr:hypothetical protein F5Y16DRAFT_380651 [Xylariaceae sp. FL0255]